LIARGINHYPHAVAAPTIGRTDNGKKKCDDGENKSRSNNRCAAAAWSPTFLALTMRRERRRGRLWTHIARSWQSPSAKLSLSPMTTAAANNRAASGGGDDNDYERTNQMTSANTVRQSLSKSSEF
jgi:hypothetical protein